MGRRHGAAAQHARRAAGDLDPPGGCRAGANSLYIDSWLHRRLHLVPMIIEKLRRMQEHAREPFAVGASIQEQ